MPKTLADLKQYVDSLEKNYDPQISVYFDIWIPMDIRDEADDLGYTICIGQAEEIIETMQATARRHGYESVEVAEEIRSFCNANNIELDD